MSTPRPSSRSRIWLALALVAAPGCGEPGAAQRSSSASVAAVELSAAPTQPPSAQHPSAIPTDGHGRPSEPTPPDSSRYAREYGHAADIPKLLAPVVSAPIRFTRVELESGLSRSTIVISRSPLKLARYEIKEGVLSGPVDVPAKQQSFIQTFGVDDVDWARIAAEAQEAGMNSGIDYAMGIHEMIVMPHPTRPGAVIEITAGHASPRGKQMSRVDAKSTTPLRK